MAIIVLQALLSIPDAGLCRTQGIAEDVGSRDERDFLTWMGGEGDWGNMPGVQAVGDGLEAEETGGVKRRPRSGRVQRNSKERRRRRHFVLEQVFSIGFTIQTSVCTYIVAYTHREEDGRNRAETIQPVTYMS